jgi:hypothetical protein
LRQNYGIRRGKVLSKVAIQAVSYGSLFHLTP